MISTIKTRTGEFFRSRLHTEDMPFYLDNADTDSQPPFGVVTVTEMRETTPLSSAYHAEVKIAVIADIDDSSSVEHDNRLAQVMKTLEQMPRRVVDTSANVRLFGWVVTQTETVTKEEAKSLADVFTIIAGVGG